MDIQQALARVVEGESLNRDEMQAVMLDAKEEAAEVLYNVALSEIASPDLAPLQLMVLAEVYADARPDQTELLAKGM